MKATLEADLGRTHLALAVRVGGAVVWSSTVPVEPWHHEVVDLIVKRSVKEKLLGALGRGLLR